MALEADRAARVTQHAEDVARRGEACLQRFLRAAEARGWPQVTEIHAAHTVDVSRFAENEKLIEALRKDPAIPRWYDFEARRNRRRLHQSIAERKRRRRDPTPVAARGWRLRPELEIGTRSSDYGQGVVREETVYAYVFLITDGRQVSTEMEHRDAVVWVLREPFAADRQPCPPLELLSELRFVSQKAGIPVEDWLDVDVEAEREVERQLRPR